MSATPSARRTALSSIKTMSERRGWSWWIGKGVLAMAVLAALALATTVLLARRALDRAADVVVLGDGEALVTNLDAELWELQWPVTPHDLETLLAKHDAQRLRYIALVDWQDHHVLAEAGTKQIAQPSFRAGELDRSGQRVRLVSIIPAPWETRAMNVPVKQRVLTPRPRLVVEFESPLIDSLGKDLTQIAAVAALAALTLIVFAIAWLRTMRRLAAVEEQAEGERRLVALGRASSVIAHELRNPLAALKGHAQLLAEDLTGPLHDKALRVCEGAERLERLLTMLLEFVREGPERLDASDVTPERLVGDALADLPKDRVRVDVSHGPDTLHVDESRVALALRNLVQNALQADDAKPVEVQITKSARDVIIEVRDHGPGLPQGSDVHIFDPFVTTKVRGTGLGLSIARRVAEQHHGTLTGETHRDGGAVFRLVLPT
jgi:two-component system sensor histidine kinase HydH